MVHRRVAVTAAVALVALAGLAGCVAAPIEVEGRVVGADGEPRAGCPIMVTALSGGPIPEFAQISGDGGTYSWRLGAGTYEITAYCAAEIGSVTVGVSTPAGDSTDIVVSETAG